MRISPNAAVQALSLLQHARNNNMSGHVKLFTYIPFISNLVFENVFPAGRRLESDFMLTAEPDELDSGPIGFGEDDQSSGGFIEILPDLIDDEIINKINQCSIDVPALATAVMAGASVVGGEEAEENEDNSASPDMMQQVFSAFGDKKDQEVCGKTDIMVVAAAFEDYIKCTGFGFLRDSFNDIDMEEIANDVSEACGWVLLNPYVTGADNMENFNVCMDEILKESSPLGRSIKNLYENPGKICSCTKTLNENIPSCVIEEEDFSMSLDVVKNSACVIGVSCDALHDSCVTEVETLDQCLPPLSDEKDFDCNDEMYQCNSLGSFLPMVPAELSMDLPDICKDIGNEGVNKRYLQFQKKCVGKKDYFLEQTDLEEAEGSEEENEFEALDPNDYEGSEEENEFEALDPNYEGSEEEEEEQELEYLKEKEEQAEAMEAKQEMQRTGGINENETLDETLENLDQQQQIEELNSLEAGRPNTPKEKKSVSLDNKAPQEADNSKENKKNTVPLTIAGVAIVGMAVAAAVVMIRKRMASRKERKDFSQLQVDYDEDDFNDGFVIS